MLAIPVKRDTATVIVLNRCLTRRKNKFFKIRCWNLDCLHNHSNICGLIYIKSIIGVNIVTHACTCALRKSHSCVPNVFTVLMRCRCLFPWTLNTWLSWWCLLSCQIMVNRVVNLSHYACDSLAHSLTFVVGRYHNQHKRTHARPSSHSQTDL